MFGRCHDIAASGRTELDLRGEAPQTNLAPLWSCDALRSPCPCTGGARNYSRRPPGWYRARVEAPERTASWTAMTPETRASQRPELRAFPRVLSRRRTAAQTARLRKRLTAG